MCNIQFPHSSFARPSIRPNHAPHCSNPKIAVHQDMPKNDLQSTPPWQVPPTGHSPARPRTEWPARLISMTGEFRVTPDYRQLQTIAGGVQIIAGRMQTLSILWNGRFQLFNHQRKPNLLKVFCHLSESIQGNTEPLHLQDFRNCSEFAVFANREEDNHTAKHG